MLKKLLIMMACAGALCAQPRVDLNEGSLFISGSLALHYQMVDFSNSQHSLSFGSDIGSGYFVADNIAIGASLPAVWSFMPISDGQFGLSVFTTYYFDIDTIIFPYLGLRPSIAYSMIEKDFRLAAAVDAGFLVSMSESVALDLGLAPKLNVALNSKQKWGIEVPAGFLGVRAFF